MGGTLLPALLRYIRHVPPKMVIGKARHTLAVRLFVRRASETEPPPEYNWNAVFERRGLVGFAAAFRAEGDRFVSDCEKLYDGEFVSNGVSYSFGSPSNIRWGQVHADPKYLRWHFDLAYFFFAIPLISGNANRGIPAIASMVQSLETQQREDPSELRKLHWSPIAVAVRTLSLATALALAPPSALKRHTDSVATIGAHIWRSAEMLKLMVERYLGFNHAAFTEAGLAVALLVQGRDHEAARSISNLVQTFELGTLGDGLWAERSPTYHLHMLVLADALKSLLSFDSQEYKRLNKLINQMRDALAAVIHPDGEIAIFNDAAIADAPTPSAVGWSLAETPDTLVLPVSGYARIARANTVAIMDAGRMGPDELIGHGHGDFLSIEVSVGSRRLIVDPGVAAITSGSDRQWTRSASSHNGPTLRGCEPAEFFGAWRVGRRGAAWFDGLVTETSGAVSISGECNGYQPWGVRVKRKIVLEGDGRLSIVDRWSGCTDSEPAVSFLIPGAWALEYEGDTRLRLRHVDGLTVAMMVRGGVVTAKERSKYFREGPMREEIATRLLIAPCKDTVITTIEPGPDGVDP